MYLVKSIAKIIIENKINDKQAILSFLDTDGKYFNETTEILNELFDKELNENEMTMLDHLISNQLKYSAIENKSSELRDLLLNLETENYDSLENHIYEIENKLDVLNRDIKDAKESLEDSKKDMNLSSNGFLNVLGNIIKKERNPSQKVKTGIQYINTMFNGGFEKGRVYCALGMAKGWKSLACHLK